ncbi:MAG: DUF2167 domain-containing protein [Bacteroidota bacterium]
MYKQLLALGLICFYSFGAIAQDSASADQALEELQAALLYQNYSDSVAASLTYEYDSVSLKGNLAVIYIPEGYKYLNGPDADMVLTDLWGNPPTSGDDQSLGMLFPENSNPLDDSSFAINITYAEEGYVSDEDADDIDYDDLLESMQEDTKSANEYRSQEGYPTIELVGWASPPFYDSDTKKLHWAKELAFEGMDVNTLNYNIRILGRKGYLQLNVIGDMSMVEEVKSSIDPILASVNFEEGSRYADFDPDVDKVAAYGIGALIAGKILTKAGIFAKLGIFFAKFWKIIALGAIAAFGALRKFFGGKKNSESSDAS